VPVPTVPEVPVPEAPVFVAADEAVAVVPDFVLAPAVVAEFDTPVAAFCAFAFDPLAFAPVPVADFAGAAAFVPAPRFSAAASLAAACLSATACLAAACFSAAACFATACCAARACAFCCAGVNGAEGVVVVCVLPGTQHSNPKPSIATKLKFSAAIGPERCMAPPMGIGNVF